MNDNLITIAKPLSEWEQLNAIADACQNLCDAVTARMSTDQPDDSKVFAMFKAHREACELLKQRALALKEMGVI